MDNVGIALIIILVLVPLGTLLGTRQMLTQLAAGLDRRFDELENKLVTLRSSD